MASVRQMARDFGEAVFMFSKFNNNSILVCNCNELYFTFKKKSSKRLADGIFVEYYDCVRCNAINGQLKARTTVKEGRVTANPSFGHHPDCLPLTKEGLEGLKLDRETRKECRQGKAPMKAFREALGKIPQNFPGDQQMQENVERHFPQYKSVRRSLCR